MTVPHITVPTTLGPSPVAPSLAPSMVAPAATTIAQAAPSTGSDAGDPLHAKLHKAADALEGMFMRQLFSAMRAATPQNGDGLGNAGGSLFTEMLDDSLADRAATQMHDGLSQALYRQLSARLTSAGGSTS